MSPVLIEQPVQSSTDAFRSRAFAPPLPIPNLTLERQMTAGGILGEACGTNRYDERVQPMDRLEFRPFYPVQQLRGEIDMCNRMCRLETARNDQRRREVSDPVIPPGTLSMQQLRNDPLYNMIHVQRREDEFVSGQ